MPATLSQIRAWSTEHLIDSAGYWTKTADQWEDTFFQIRNQSYALDWDGAGGAALRERTSADLPLVSAKADVLRQAAGIARDGASGISAAQRRVLYAIEDAQNVGFTVGEDLSVTDTRSSGTAAEQVARHAQAQAFAGDIRLRAEQLDAAEVKVAGQLSATRAGLSGIGFAENPIFNPVAHAPANRIGIQPVDFKQDSGAPPPFAPWDTADETPPPGKGPFNRMLLPSSTPPLEPDDPLNDALRRITNSPARPAGPLTQDQIKALVDAEVNDKLSQAEKFSLRTLLSKTFEGCGAGGIAAGVGGLITGPLEPLDIAGGCAAGAIGDGGKYLFEYGGK
ncbi:hypothetical protein DSM43518_04954 [Mycobacterium marinum]|uniref:hypothetical protein n=1 Tax=Mycobacterium marinum TaxID=1781 RepID=UPI00035884A1|nr:hypothetical protein [Mycobacterium marinum]AXN51410.1 hypothetical protein CCUG20998_04016 [Mycobacterium marinum]EPQ74606.1 hypothetical protein MMEU_2266 [Mycobacterium marinum str. Europe]RFZ02965.1 hypothetical protein DSM43518_04954 [Mycobacterium marinum]RFZ21690.1 hypothetical protein VIMS_00469 [Mycobacterium marinum]RFZ26156.1 hypothetical protein DSM43519_01472 [Mycobacterium marinum]